MLHDGWLCEACRPPPHTAALPGAQGLAKPLICSSSESGKTHGGGTGPDLALEGGRLGQTGLGGPGHMASQSVTVNGYML